MSALCEHLRTALPGALPFEERLPIEAHDGPITGIVSCSKCRATALLELLDWGGPANRRRIYRVSGIASHVVEQFEARGGRASCDAGRAGGEIELLLSTAGPIERLFAIEMDEARLLANGPVSGDRPVPLGHWRDALGAAGDGRWFRLLGVPR